MERLQPALALWSLGEKNLPLRTRIERVRRALASPGRIGLQFDSRHELRPEEFGETACRQLRHFLSEIDFRATTLRFPARRSLYDPDRLEPRIEALKRTLDLASRLGVTTVCTGIGLTPASGSPERSLLVDVLEDVASLGTRIGVTLAVTPPPGEVPAELNALLDSVHAGYIGVDFDPTPYLPTGCEDVIRQTGERVAHVTVRDGSRDLSGRAIRETSLGGGEVDWSAALAVLDEIGFNKVATVTRFDEPTTDRLEEFDRALTYLRNVANE